MKILECINISKNYGDKQVLSDITFTLFKNDFISIVGKSGVGKSTILDIIGKIKNQSSGEVIYHSNIDRPIFVFQQYNTSIYPWFTIYENLELVLNKNNKNKDDIEEKIDYYLSLVGLKDFKNLYPRELSGGMQQRVAIARSLVVESKLLLLDEPFGSLDLNTRNELESDLLNLATKLGLTIVMITHDIEEAIFLSNKVFYIDDTTNTISKKFTIDLAYPRSHETTRLSDRFIQLKKEIFTCFIK